MFVSRQHVSTGSPRPSMPPPIDGDIRDLLRRDHDYLLSRIDVMHMESDFGRCQELLQDLRRSWLLHVLAEETVVYRYLEGVEAALESRNKADERMLRNKLVEVFFEKLGQCLPGGSTWHARLNVLRVLILQHNDAEQEDIFALLERHLDARALKDMARRFASVKEKLGMLEEAKATTH